MPSYSSPEILVTDRVNPTVAYVGLRHWSSSAGFASSPPDGVLRPDRSSVIRMVTVTFPPRLETRVVDSWVETSTGAWVSTAGVTALVAVDGSEVPFRFVAVTVNVYA